MPDVAGFDKELDYSVPAQMAGELRPGSVVRVPLRGRKVRGWVLAFPVEAPPGLGLRPLAKVSGWGPEPALIDLASWAAWWWAGRRRSLLVTASAQVAVRALPAPALGHNPAGGRALAPATADGAGRTVTGPGERSGRRTGADLFAQAWRAGGAGAQVLRLPPAASAMELVLAAAERGPVLVLVPTTARAESGAALLRARGVGVALLPQEWAQARAGARVVIGSRGAAWGPCPGMVSVVVLDAHDEAYVQGQSPAWGAAAVAAERALRSGAPCLWVTPCPTLELLAAASHTHLPSRDEERAGWAALQVVDRRREDPRSGLFSRQLVALLRGGGRVACVLNRKGRAQLVGCGACGELATCERCGSAVAMTGGTDATGELLECRHCGEVRPVVCARCGSTALRALRLGVAGVRGQLEALAGRPVGEVSAGSGPLPDAPVVVGTETILYREAELQSAGGAAAIAFLDFDQELLAPRYRAGEEALALLARASRLVGGRAGRVLVQTRTPSHPVLKAALLADPGRLAEAEGPVRRQLRLPPFSALALLSGPGAAEMAESLGAGVERSQLGEDRFVVRAPDHASLAAALAAARRPSGRVRVEVGPLRF
ncbi:MAG: hypothetical protein M0005_15310 [Actinomycetota bacterium]|nr:hypothetical protein [Actinomycetota bacterium]